MATWCLLRANHSDQSLPHAHLRRRARELRRGQSSALDLLQIPEARVQELVIHRLDHLNITRQSYSTLPLHIP
jgi:hypothetical protein